MGLFSKFKKTEEQPSVATSASVEIGAPISGEVINIEDVPDVVFSEKIVGDGLGIVPTSSTVVAPIDGTIGKIFETRHAFSITSDNGVEVFVHVGLDTVELKGEGFTQLAQDKQVVKKGEPILELDLEFLEKNAKSLATPIVISNSDDMKSIIKTRVGETVAAAETILTVSTK